MSYGWNDRPTKVEPRYLTGGDEPARIFEIGKYRVTVPNDPEATVTYTVPTNYQAERPQETFPNMTVADGEVRFPVDDLVPVILSRLDPVDLAEKLWANDEVREHFIECAVERYSQAGVCDADRRKLIEGLQDAVYSAALDKAINILGNLEYRFGQKWYFWDQIARARQTIENIYPDAADSVHIASPDSDQQFKVVGTNWADAREFWRDELRSLFPLSNPAPAIPAVSVNAAAPEAAPSANIHTPARGAEAAAGIGSEL